MGETLDSLGAKFDMFSNIVKDGMEKLNKIVIGNGTPGLCEQVRDINKRLDDMDVSIGMANNHALAAKEIAKKAGDELEPILPQNITVNANQGFDWESAASFFWKHKGQIIPWTLTTGASVWAFCEHFIFKHLR